MLRPVIDRTLPFRLTTDNIVEQGRTRAGKVVVTMAGLTATVSSVRRQRRPVVA